MSSEQRRLMSGGEPMVNQGTRHGWTVSWNPDDERYYVSRTDGTTAATFAGWANAMYYCKTHRAE